LFSKRFLRDAAERVGATFVEAAAGAVILAGTLNLDVAKAAGLTGTMAALTLVKTLLAQYVGDHATASVLPQKHPFDEL
jgi:hypothetical protein